MIEKNIIENKIYIIRGQKVMLDRDLAFLYQTETKKLKQAVKRNIKRFPKDFMFELTEEELKNWRSQNVTSNSDKMGLRYKPMAFTEHGIMMLASVLKSEVAAQVNIQIVRVFIEMRNLLQSHNELLVRIQKNEKHLEEHDDSIFQIMEYLKQFARDKDQGERRRIGF